MRRGRDANDARLFAQVYLDPGGQTMSMYYSFHPKELPEPGSKRVGIVVSDGCDESPRSLRRKDSLDRALPHGRSIQQKTRGYLKTSD